MEEQSKRQSPKENPEPVYLYCKYFEYSDTPNAEVLKNDLNGHPKPGKIYCGIKNYPLYQKNMTIVRVEDEDRGNHPGFDGVGLIGLKQVGGDFSYHFEEFKVTDVFDLNVPQSEIDKVVRWEKEKRLEKLMHEEDENKKEQEREEGRELIEKLLGPELAKLLPSPRASAPDPSSAGEEEILSEVDFREILQDLDLGFLETSIIESTLKFANGDRQDPEKLLAVLDYLKVLMTYEYGEDFTEWALTERGS